MPLSSLETMERVLLLGTPNMLAWDWDASDESSRRCRNSFVMLSPLPLPERLEREECFEEAGGEDRGEELSEVL